jgi:hypothetical protein
MAALGVDLVSSLARGTGKVITGATGELVLWQGLLVPLTGGVATLGMSMYGDLSGRLLERMTIQAGS